MQGSYCQAATPEALSSASHGSSAGSTTCPRDLVAQRQAQRPRRTRRSAIGWVVWWSVRRPEGRRALALACQHHSLPGQRPAPPSRKASRASEHCHRANHIQLSTKGLALDGGCTWLEFSLAVAYRCLAPTRDAHAVCARCSDGGGWGSTPRWTKRPGTWTNSAQCRGARWSIGLGATRRIGYGRFTAVICCGYPSSASPAREQWAWRSRFSRSTISPEWRKVYDELLDGADYRAGSLPVHGVVGGAGSGSLKDHRSPISRTSGASLAIFDCAG